MGEEAGGGVFMIVFFPVGHPRSRCCVRNVWEEM